MSRDPVRIGSDDQPKRTVTTRRGRMAHIRYLPNEDIPLEHRVDDTDNILCIHGVHSRVMRLHYDLYVELMRRPGPLTRVRREMIATAVSAANGCHY